MKINEVDPRNFDSDIDYYAALNAKPKARTPGEPRLSPAQQDAEDEDSISQQRQSAHKAFAQKRAVKYVDQEGSAPNGEKYNKLYVIQAQDAGTADHEEYMFDKHEWGAKKVVDVKKEKNRDGSVTHTLFIVDNHKYGMWKPWKNQPAENTKQTNVKEFAPDGFNSGGDNSNDLQLYLDVAKKLNMKKYKPSTAHALIAKKMAELVDVVDDDKVDYARHMARKAQGLPNMLEQGVAEGSLEEVDRRGFLKGLGAAAVAGAAGSAEADWRKGADYKDPMDDKVYRKFHNTSTDGYADLDYNPDVDFLKFQLRHNGGVFLPKYSHPSGRLRVDNGPVIPISFAIFSNSRNVVGLYTGNAPAGPENTKLEQYILSAKNRILIDVTDLTRTDQKIISFNIQQRNESVNQGVAEDRPIPKAELGKAVALSNLGKFHAGVDTLGKWVPERLTHQFALDPNKWEHTFYSLTLKEPKKIRYYRPKNVDIVPGTLVGDMAIANQFYRTKDPAEQEKYALAYLASLKPYPVNLDDYEFPELLIPRNEQGVAEGLSDDVGNIYALHPDENEGESVAIQITDVDLDEFDDLWTALPMDYLNQFGGDLPLWDSEDLVLYPNIKVKAMTFDQYVDLVGNYIRSDDMANTALSKMKKGVAEEQLDELKCWPGYTRVRGVPAGAPGSCKKKTNEDKSKHIDSDTVRRIQELLNKKFNANLDVDGILGPLTIQSLKKFLPKTVKKAAPNPERNTAVQGLELKEEKCPECGGPIFNEVLLNEKKDACYYKVKSRYKVWPSAYASGALVKCRNKGAKNWGNKSESIGENKIYFAIPKSLENEQELTESFKFKKDHYGWYLKEGQENFKKTYSNALKAFTIIK